VGRRLLLPKAIEAFEMADNGAALARHWPDTDGTGHITARLARVGERWEPRAEGSERWGGTLARYSILRTLARCNVCRTLARRSMRRRRDDRRVRPARGGVDGVHSVLRGALVPPPDKATRTHRRPGVRAASAPPGVAMLRIRLAQCVCVPRASAASVAL
jgi:hypothetical protein